MVDYGAHNLTYETRFPFFHFPTGTFFNIHPKGFEVAHMFQFSQCFYPHLTFISYIILN